MATPARADHRGSFAIVGHVGGNWGCHNNGRVVWQTRRFDQCEFDRGFAKGTARGFDAGYLDGIHGRSYCDVPGASLTRVSCEFREGYLKAFSRNYAVGFEKGRCEFACARPRVICR
jgi:hypothetical protein